MTQNQIRNKEAENTNAANIRRDTNERARNKEIERANRAQERLKQVDQRIQKVATAGKIVNDAFGNLVGGAKAIGTFANDPSWYNFNKQLVLDAASLSYHTPLSTAMTSSTLATSTSNPRASAVCLKVQLSPGIGGYDLAGRPSANSLYNSSVRVAAQNLYAWVRHANSGASNYEASDLMMYILAMDSAYAMYAWGRSIYRMANSATAFNFTWLEDIANATGFSISDFRSNLANMRTFLNLCATRLNALAVPNSLPYFNRHVWMFSNIFKDSNVDRCSYYVFYPNARGVYIPSQARINYYALPTLLNFQKYVGLMNEIIDVLMSDEDIGIISGDIRKAYGSDKLFQIENTPVDDYVEPFYSEEVLTQISGATLCGELLAGSYDICQTYNGYIYQGTYVDNATSIPALNQLYPNISFKGDSGFEHTGWVINMYKDDPVPDDNMVATRLMAQTASTTIEQKQYRMVILSGSEFVVNATIVGYLGGNDRTTITISDFQSYSAQLTVFLPQLDWFPQFVYNVASSTPNAFFYYVSDLSNYAIIGFEQLRNMHNVAMLSLFAIPSEGLR